MKLNNQSYQLFFLIILLSVFSINNVSAMELNFFYSPTCSHCQAVFPTVESLYLSYNDPLHKWNSYDVTKGSYNVEVIPTMKIETNDCREIELLGSYEINKYFECELQEMSTKKCITYSNTYRGSYFIER